MTELRGVLETWVERGSLPGAVGLVAHRDRVEVASVGWVDVERSAPMARDSIFRVASLTKPITAAAVMVLVEEGRVGLHDPVDRWLPELADPVVVRTPASPVRDVVPAVRPITVFDLLTSCAGYGFPSDFTLPAVRLLATVQKDGREPRSFPAPDVWLAELGRVPLLCQPGEAWLYDTCSTLQGVLVERVSGRTLPDFLAERVFTPLGMVDSAFHVPAARRDRFTSAYRVNPAGRPRLVDGPDGQWSTPPEFALGSAGLTGTVDDWLAFGRMLLAGGIGAGGRRLLSTEAVALITSDHTTPARREFGELFLEGQGWGMGGSVDIERTEPWHVPGRYGWVGGTGTAAHVVPATGTVAILLTQAGPEGPATPEWMRDFWRYAAAG